jgi:hypothetical protein
MDLKKLACSTALVAALAIGSWSSSVCLAQRTASAALSADAGQSTGENLNDRSTDKGFSTDDFLPGESGGRNKTTIKPTSQQASTKGLVPVRVTINTPHNADQVNTLVAYPYPPKPPRIKQVIKMLASTEKEGLRNLIISEGYSARTGRFRPYPSQGWRWQYAFHAALRRSGLGYPHVIAEMYTWADDMEKYVKIEVVRSNHAEKARASRYEDAVKDYEENSVEIEQDAVTHARFPTEVKFDAIDERQSRNGKVFLAPGKWWMTGLLKVAGLKYYWQVPFEIEEGTTEQQLVELTEANALVIQGAW